MRIKPTMAFERSLRRLVGRELRSLTKLLESVLQGDVEAIHDFRAGIRRIRTLLGVAKGSRANRFRRGAGKIAKSLGEVRDLDVTLELVNSNTFAGGRVSDWVTDLKAVREERLQKLSKSFGGKKFEDWHANMAHWARKKKGGQNTIEGLRSTLVRTVGDARNQSLGTSAPDLHRLRIAVKETRYLIELFSGVLPANSQDVAKKLELTQDAFGSDRDWTRFAEIAATSPYGLEIQGGPPKAEQAHLVRMASDALNSVAALLADFPSFGSQEESRRT